ncbi:MAG: lysophospholipid acyltransferase family protein [Gammaproteobacteria bacterium]|nr:lysophospholipid acyltransferase family protein [Gammaproteobacteria bacterium]
MTIVIASLFILLFPIQSKTLRNRIASFWCTSALNWLRFSCGVQYQIIGLENLPARSAVYVANHQSSWEAILLYKLAYPVSPILKKELLRIPFWGWSMRLQQPIAIDRSNPREAGKSMLTQGVERLNRGMSVIVFPEGSRSPAGAIKKFSRGGAKLAIAAGAPIVPISHNAGDCWPPRKFIKQPGLITVTIGEAIDSSKHSASELTEKIERWIRDNCRTSRS